MASRYGVDRLREQALFNNMGNVDINDPMGGINTAPSEPYQLRSRPQVDTSNDPYGGINEAPPSIGPELNIGTNQPSGDIPNLRIQNIAPPSAPTYGDRVDPYEEAKQLFDLQNRLYTPQTAQSERYNRILDEFPEYEKPSFARKLTSAMLGMKGGIDVQDKVLHGPYARAVAQWKAEEEPLRQAATLENQQNTQERTLAGNVISNVAANRRVTQQENAAKAANDIAQQRVNIAAAVARKATFHAEGDRIIAMFPDGHTEDAGPSRNFSPMELANLNNASREAIARGAQQTDRDVAEIRERPPFIINVNGESRKFDPATGTYVTGTGLPQGTPTIPGTPRTATGIAGDGITQLEIGRGRQNRLEQAAVYGPWSKFVKKNGSNYEPVEPTAGFMGWGTVPAAEQAEYDNFIKYVYQIPEGVGGGQQQAAPPPPPAAAPPSQGAVPPTPPQPTGNPAVGVGGAQRYMQPTVPVPGTPTVGVGGRQRYMQPETAAPPQETQPPSVSSTGDILVVDKQTGKQFYIAPGNLDKALVTGRYEQVK